MSRTPVITAKNRFKHAFVLLCSGLLLVQNAPAKLFDGGVDSANLGKGEWIYVLSSYFGSYVPSVNSVDTMMAYCRTNLGCQFVVIKSASGATLYPSATSPQFTRSVVDKAHAKGLKIFGYTRSTGTDVPGEVAMADYVFNCGADGFIFDAESEWESQNLPNNTTKAWQMCGQVKTNWPTKFLAHSPFPIISYHSTFPYKEFGYWCDNAMPQIYWVDFNKTPQASVDWTDTNWRNWQNSLTGIYTNSIKPLAPIGQADATSQMAAGSTDILDFVNYLKVDPNCVTVGGYKGVLFFRPGLQNSVMLDEIAAASIGDSNSLPAILAQPQGASLVVGQTANFSVSAYGVPNPAFQWRLNGAGINGATSSSYSKSNLQLSDAGSYTVVVSNSVGAVTSDNAVLVVTAQPVAPTITTQPNSQTAISGQTALFTVAASGTTPLSYQWYYNGAPITGATTNTYSRLNAQAGNTGSYSVVIGNSAGTASSSIAVLSVNFSLTINSSSGGSVRVSPDQISFAPGSTATLSAIVQPGYFFNGWTGDASGKANPLDLLMDTNKSVTANFSGSAVEIIIDNPQATVVGSWSTGSSSSDKYGADYRFKSQGSGAAYLEYVPTIFDTGNYEIYEWHPQGGNRSTAAPFVINYDGGSATVPVNEQGNGGKWNLLGTYSFVQGTNGNVHITDGFPDAGKVVLADAIRFVLVAIPINTPSGLAATTINSSQINLNWLDNSDNEDFFIVARSTVSGGPYTDIATLPTGSTNYTDSGLTDNTTYYYVVRAKSGNFFSPNCPQASAKTLAGPPTITLQPDNQTVVEGDNVTFSVIVHSSTTVKYQWQFGSSNISGATNSSLTLTNVSSANAGVYSVIASNLVGAVISDPASLTINYRLDLSSVPASGGAISTAPAQTGYAANDLVLLTPVPNPNYTFIGWSGDGGGTNVPLAVTMQRSKSVVANFISSDDIVVDNPDALYTGNWVIGSAAANAYGDYYQYALSGTDYADAIYAPQINAAGKYDVFIWYPSGTNRTANAPITIVFNNDATATSVDETTGGGKWQLLASQVDFAQGNSGYVQIANTTGEQNKVVVADAARFVFVSAPVLVNFPQDQTAKAGDDAAFSVLAAGTAPISYRWQHNGVNIPGATNNAISRSMVQGADAGTYSVVVSNRVGAAGASATLTVLAPAAPRFIGVSRGADGGLSFTLTGDANAAYSIDVSTDLVNWTPLTNVLNFSGSFSYAESKTNSAERFYRARWSR